MNKLSAKKGFTLVELLIVIVIIGILAGVVLAVINPAATRGKANASVMRANLDKLCLAMLSCTSTTSSATLCNEFTEISAFSNAPPTGAAFTIGPAADLITVSAGFTNHLGATCEYRCDHNVSSGISGSISAVSAATCYNL